MEFFLDNEHLQYYNQEIKAKAEIYLLYSIIKEKNSNISFKDLLETKNILIEKEPHNIVLKNSLNYFLYNLHKEKIHEHAKKKYDYIVRKLEQSIKDVAFNVSKKIKNSSKIFIHSINNTLKEALLNSNKKFEINLLEHKPYGELFATRFKEKFKEKGIKLKLYRDIEIKDALENVDYCFIGGDAILKTTEAIAKKGSYVISELTKKNKIPFYVVTTSMKYHHDEHINNSFLEKIPIQNLTAYICEYGIFKPEHIKEEIFFHNNWLLISSSKVSPFLSLSSTEKT